MIVLSGADLVLPDRLISPGTIVIDGDRIVDVLAGALPRDGAVFFDLSQRYVVPGFIDVHVHGVGGADVLDEDDGAVARVAERLPRYGVTAFCPTTIACRPDALRAMLAAVRRARTTRPAGGARVLAAHLESNFISAEYKGAQPLECLRRPPRQPRKNTEEQPQKNTEKHGQDGEWTGDDILAEIAAARPDVGIVTVAPELDGAIDLIRDLVAHGHHVSLGHSGATYDQGIEGIRAGARQATHLFNRMTPIAHRAPGLAGAVLESDEVVAEVICDGVHVHPAMVRVALGAKRPERFMAITDGTAGAGLPRGARTRLGGRAITVGDAAYLDDGTIAGSVLTMDRAFALLVAGMGLSLSDAALVCSTTPARALGLQGFGVLSPGSTADFTVLDRDLTVVQTWVGGMLAWQR